jgi:hypothetical protein
MVRDFIPITDVNLLENEACGRASETILAQSVGFALGCRQAIMAL